MRMLGLAGAPGPGTAVQHPGHKVYPYLLRGVAVVRPNHMWSTDITYIRLARGFAYLVAIIDWYSRRVLAWRISNSMDASFCVHCLEEALVDHGKPAIFNTDQGSQFTSLTFTGVLKRESVDISMDGQGWALDNIFVERLWRNVKYEDVYLNGYATMGELHAGLTRYFAFYNGERPNQALSYQTPDLVYASGKGGGAMIVDKYGDAPGSVLVEEAQGQEATTGGEHGALPQTPRCREPTAMIPLLLPLLLLSFLLSLSSSSSFFLFFPHSPMYEFKHDRAALIRCGRNQDHCLNSGKICLDGGGHFTPHF